MTIQDELPDDPNDAPGAPGKRDRDADFSLALPLDRLRIDGDTCPYLGGEYQHGDTICHKGGVWVCRNRQWQNLHEACQDPR